MRRMSAADTAGHRRDLGLPTGISRASRFAIALSICLFSWSNVPLAEPARAGEPAERFLEQLRAAGYHELALHYLDHLDRYPGVPAEFLTTAGLERAQVLIEAAQASRTAAQRDEYIAASNQALQQFIQRHPNHPRTPEAQLKLGNMQIVRGVQLMELGGPPDAARRSQAREVFSAAAETFNGIVADLRTKLEGMKGQKINAEEEPEKVAIRAQYRADYLQALLLSGDAMRRVAETFASEDSERAEQYNKALAQFEQIRDKYDEELASVYAALYAGQIYQALGDPEKALDRYLEVLDQNPIDALRPLKAKAATGLARVYLAKQPPEPKAAIDRGQAIVDDIRPDERRAPEWQELKLVLADAYLQLAGSTEAAAEQRRYTSSARELLLAASKVPGASQQAASRRLAELGVGSGPSSALERAASLPQSFGETIEVVDEILEEEKNLTLAAQLLEERSTQGQAVTAELTSARESLQTLRSRGIQLLRHAMTQTDSETSLAAINEARASLAFLLYRSERLREAAVVGSFIARRYPSSEMALSSGLTALASLQLALRDAEGTPDGLLAQLQELAEHLVSQWPSDPRVATARTLLVRIAISRDRFEDAQRFLGELPDGEADKHELQQAMGKMMWNRYVQLHKAGEAEAAAAMRNDAAAALAAGLTPLKAEQVDGDDLETALLLSRIQLLNGQPVEAMATLEAETYGPLRRIDSITPANEGFRGEMYATALQALVSQLTAEGVDSVALMQRAGELLKGLESAYEGQPDGSEKLVGTYFRLARDIRDQLDAAAPEQKQKLTAAFRLFLNSLAAQTDDPKTLHWAAQTLLQLGQGMMEPGAIKATGQAAELIRSSMSLLEKIADRAAREPDWVSDQMRTQIRLELGTAARAIGEYKKAIDSLSAVLAENQMLIDAQVEAALVYEQWAATLPEQYATVSYRRAISGAKPDPKTRRNTVWGWGRIAQRTMGQKGFEATFFDARYHLALSRFLQGKKESSPDEAKSLFQKASEDVRNVLVRYPDMGGPPSRKKFDALLREIQKTLDRPTIGLAEFETSAAK